MKARNCQKRVVSGRWGHAVAALAAPVIAVGCASGQGECRAETWSGTCQLVSVTKTRQSELPLPNVTLQALYRPQPGDSGPTLMPPDQAKDFTVLDRYEDALRTHLDGHKAPRCFVNPPPPGQCVPGQLVVEVPEFDAEHASVAPDNSRPKGCAQIESTSSQDRITQAKTSETIIRERFQFGEQSSELASDAATALDALAARLKQSPNLQCVGVVGAWIRGENVALAFARARAVREQLVARGVEPERLLALTVDPPTLSASTAAEPPNPNDRKVTLSVLLDLPAAR